MANAQTFHVFLAFLASLAFVCGQGSSYFINPPDLSNDQVALDDITFVVGDKIKVEWDTPYLSSARLGICQEDSRTTDNDCQPPYPLWPWNLSTSAAEVVLDYQYPSLQPPTTFSHINGTSEISLAEPANRSNADQEAEFYFFVTNAPDPRYSNITFWSHAIYINERSTSSSSTPSSPTIRVSPTKHLSPHQVSAWNSNAGKPDLSQREKIGLGVGLGAGLACIALGVAAFIFMRRRRRHHSIGKASSFFSHPPASSVQTGELHVINEGPAMTPGWKPYTEGRAV